MILAATSGRTTGRPSAIRSTWPPSPRTCWDRPPAGGEPAAADPAAVAAGPQHRRSAVSDPRDGHVGVPAVYSFHMTLSYSRDPFSCFTTSMDLATFWDCHRRGFAHFAGVPADPVHVLPGPGGVIGDALASDRRSAKISFTGETATGASILRASADHIARVSLELGGKSAAVVFADADLAAAAADMPAGVFGNAGQDCCARSRILVERPVYDEFLEAFRAHTEAIVVGFDHGRDARIATDRRPTRHQHDRLPAAGHLDRARNHSLGDHVGTVILQDWRTVQPQSHSVGLRIHGKPLRQKRLPRRAPESVGLRPPNHTERSLRRIS